LKQPNNHINFVHSNIEMSAGKVCNEQMLVINDAIGMGDKWPPFSRQYAHVSKIIAEAAETFVSQVKARTY
jgi:3-methyl-2-oxobutanoate hydroxymethyltransferase